MSDTPWAGLTPEQAFREGVRTLMNRAADRIDVFSMHGDQGAIVRAREVLYETADAINNCPKHPIGTED